jgi:hypothetical protein
VQRCGTITIKVGDNDSNKFTVLVLCQGMPENRNPPLAPWPGESRQRIENRIIKNLELWCRPGHAASDVRVLAAPMQSTRRLLSPLASRLAYFFYCAAFIGWNGPY